jgi:4-hydroxy-tetrahydrodipicolinate synthase
VVETCVRQAAGRVKVIAGCGSNCTRSAIANVKAAQERGADAALCVVPYYNKPSQDGIYAHFEAISRASSLPIIVYNVPSRTVADASVETLSRLAGIATIVGVKDATGNLARVSAQRLACGEGFVQLSGNDDMALGFMTMGGAGCISVTANVAPRLCADFQNACMSGDWKTALKLQDKLYPLHSALFSDASPGPTKYAVTRIRPGFPGGLRLPMTSADEASRRAVDAALAHAGLL